MSSASGANAPPCVLENHRRSVHATRSLLTEPQSSPRPEADVRHFRSKRPLPAQIVWRRIPITCPKRGSKRTEPLCGRVQEIGRRKRRPIHVPQLGMRHRRGLASISSGLDATFGGLWLATLCGLFLHFNYDQLWVHAHPAIAALTVALLVLGFVVGVASLLIGIAQLAPAACASERLPDCTVPGGRRCSSRGDRRAGRD